MLVVKLSIHPGGDPSRAYDIGTLEIGNVSDLAEVSDYVYKLDAADVELAGKVTGHRRSQPQGAWRLLRTVLVDAFGRGGK